MAQRSVLISLSAVLLCPGLLPGKPAKVDYRKVDREIQAHNAARMDKGGRIRLELLGEKVVKDRRTFPPHVVDGDVHSRQVITGVPYRFRACFSNSSRARSSQFISRRLSSQPLPSPRGSSSIRL